MQKRRPTPEISISFLDVICCGFGAVILLLMITKTVQPQVLEESTVIAEGRVAELTTQLFEIRGETATFNRDLAAKKEQLSNYEEQIARLVNSRDDSRAKYEDLVLVTEQEQNASNRERGQLALAKQRLTEVQKRLLGLKADRVNKFIGGIPIDSEYVIFVIDTSPSMWMASAKVTSEIEGTLALYPTIKGIQVLNGNGKYLFPAFAGRWIPDTPQRRSLILGSIPNWTANDVSDPTTGIEQAIQSFSDGKKKVSIYVYGDDFFLGGSISKVIRTVDSINRGKNAGDRLVRVHAIGFPVMYKNPRQVPPGTQVPPGYLNSHIRFANLMRELAHRNGGTFVGLADYE